MTRWESAMWESERFSCSSEAEVFSRSSWSGSSRPWENVQAAEIQVFEGRSVEALGEEGEVIRNKGAVAQIQAFQRSLEVAGGRKKGEVRPKEHGWVLGMSGFMGETWGMRAGIASMELWDG
ncbi:hypothetical protein TURU_001199 [Turdus rufiventris]|nr:hypothetical protein TURU_001199 [Turdus rufiventris]